MYARFTKPIDYAAILLIALFAFSISFMAGQNGFESLDQSITFDGGYRIFTGQVPFRDFVFAHSLIAFWLVALFFKLLGVSFAAFLICGALINVAATICSIIITRLLFQRRYLSYMAGFLTAIWFNAPYCTPQAEQTSFLFSFIAITILLLVLCGKPRHPIFSTLLLFLSGLGAFLAFLSRQNVGAFILPLFFLLIVAGSLNENGMILKRSIVFSLGFLAGVAVFLLWLFHVSDLDRFYQHFIRLPLNVGVERTGLVFNWLIWVEKGTSLPIIAIPSVVLGLCLYNFNKARLEWRLPFLASILCLYSILSQLLLWPSSVFTYPFKGIIVSIEAGLAFFLLKSLVPRDVSSFFSGVRIPSQKVLRTVLAILISVFFVIYSIRGVRYSFKLDDQTLLKTRYSSFKEVNAPELKPLKWGDYAVTANDIDNLVGYLKERDKNLFVFPVFFVLYGIIGKPSPQPLLWFHRGLTYPEVYDPMLDSQIVSSLRQNMVEIVVTGGDLSSEEVEEEFNDFPVLKSYVFGDFRKTREIGNFTIYEKR